MTDDQIALQVKSLIEASVVKALNSAPEALEKLVKAALTKPVGENGRFDAYGAKMPYLDWLVGEEIRSAAAQAARKVIQEHAADIESHVRSGLSSDGVVAAVTKALIAAASEDWKIRVTFGKEDR